MDRADEVARKIENVFLHGHTDLTKMTMVNFIAAERDALKAEISRLKAELDQAIKAATDWQNKLTEQRDLYKSLAEKAREALKRLANGESDDLAANPAKWSCEIAKKALSAFPAEGMKGGQ